MTKRTVAARGLGAAPTSKMIDDFIGFFAGKTDKVATLEELDAAASDGWAGLHWAGPDSRDYID